MKEVILVCNAGSATLKYRVFDARTLRMRQEGIVERIGLDKSFIRHRGVVRSLTGVRNHADAFRMAWRSLGLDPREVRAVGHRVVHGGEAFTGPTRINDRVWRRLVELIELAPLHNPASTAVIKACRSLLPVSVPNVAVFDTAFFASMPAEHYRYAVPETWYRQYGIRRYGFHGISHQYAAAEAARTLGRSLRTFNAITLHLGNGCSATAIRNGQPLVNSMGFTPLEGLVMGTRSGNLDPAIPLLMQRRLRQSASEIQSVLNKESGLRGLSGFSSDMRELLRAAGYRVIDYHGRNRFSAAERQRAQLAIDVYVNRIRHYVGGYATLLPRVDAIVFTGGVGERSPVIRKLVTERLPFSPQPKVVVIPANEELAIARAVRTVVY